MADLAANAEVPTEEHHQAAGRVPREMILAILNGSRREIHVRLHQPQPNQPVGLHGPEPGRDHPVAHQRQHARRDTRNVAKEILRISELELASEDASEAADRYTPVQIAVLAI